MESEIHCQIVQQSVGELFGNPGLVTRVERGRWRRSDGRRRRCRGLRGGREGKVCGRDDEGRGKGIKDITRLLWHQSGAFALIGVEAGFGSRL